MFINLLGKNNPNNKDLQVLSQEELINIFSKNWEIINDSKKQEFEKIQNMNLHKN